MENADKLEKALNKGLSEKIYTVKGEAEEIVNRMRNNDIVPRPNELGACAEPKAFTAAHDNPSPITGMETLSRYGNNHGHPYTGNTDYIKGLDNEGRMDPCGTCQDAEKVYVEYGNENKVNHAKGGL